MFTDTLLPTNVPSTSLSLTNADPASRELAVLQTPVAAVPAPLDKAPSDDVAGPELADTEADAPNEVFRLKNRQRMVLEFMNMGMNISDIAKLTKCQSDDNSSVDEV